MTFSKKVIKLALSIPFGRVTTYGILAEAAGGHPMLARMITHLLSKSPDADHIPFHRIVYSHGRVWLDDRHRQSRLELYRQERIILDSKNKIVNFSDIVYGFHLF